MSAAKKPPPKVVWLTVGRDGRAWAPARTKAEALGWAADDETVHRYVLADPPKRKKAVRK